MACYYPLRAWRWKGAKTANGKVPLIFKYDVRRAGEELEVPCGQCIGCRLERSRQWAIRCIHEAQLHRDTGGNCYITLTYDDKNLPYCVDEETGEMLPTLVKRDMVLFLKRLRKMFGPKIRFFQCGEYGEENQRPHHHAILFNHEFKDQKFWKTVNGFPVYVSETLSKLWPYGIHAIGEVTFESAAYVARYILKKANGNKAYSHYRGRLPEYVTMSRRPGIADGWFKKFSGDCYPSDKITLRGRKMRPPKFYDSRYELEHKEELAGIKSKRMEEAKKSPDNTPERRKAREGVKQAQVKMLIRKFEKDGV